MVGLDAFAVARYRSSVALAIIWARPGRRSRFSMVCPASGRWPRRSKLYRTVTRRGQTVTKRLASAAAALVTGMALGACSSSGTTEASRPGPPPSSPPQPTVTPTAGAVAPSRQLPSAAVLPNFVGKGLQYAQDEAQAVGFFVLTSHDSTGRGPTQISDRNWKVCFQSPLVSSGQCVSDKMIIPR